MPYVQYKTGLKRPQKIAAFKELAYELAPYIDESKVTSIICLPSLEAQGDKAMLKILATLKPQAMICFYVVEREKKLSKQVLNRFRGFVASMKALKGVNWWVHNHCFSGNVINGYGDLPESADIIIADVCSCFMRRDKPKVKRMLDRLGCKVFVLNVLGARVPVHKRVDEPVWMGWKRTGISKHTCDRMPYVMSMVVKENL